MAELKALDLFCGAGGASKGLADAGFAVTGVDIVPQRHYPFVFLQKDVLKLKASFLCKFDFIWASPPCQAFSVASHKYRIKGKKYLNLIPQTRELLIKSKVPYCIENVGGAPLQNPIMLCGAMFGLGVFRHRFFELSWGSLSPHHPKHTGTIGDGKYFCIAGGGGRWRSWGKHKKGITKGSAQQWRDAMGIQWMSGKELTQAIPPAYSKYIAEQFLIRWKRWQKTPFIIRTNIKKNNVSKN